MQDSTPILAVRGLDISFGTGEHRAQVVQGAEFALEAGRCLGIVGESGSGKTITSLSIVGLSPKGAQVKAEGMTYSSEQGDSVDLASLRSTDIRKYRGAEIAIIFQEPLSSLNPSMRCGMQIDEMLQLHTSLSRSQRRTRVLDLLTKVKLHDPLRVYRSYPHQLSGGQLQRVMIAMAISCEPRILIADEPTTALDVTVQSEILALLQKLQREMDMSMIFISHDLAVIAQVADHIAVMRAGKIVEQGPCDQVISYPQHDYTKALLACRPDYQYDSSRLVTIDTAHEQVLRTAKTPDVVINRQELPVMRVEGLHVNYPQRQGGKRTVYAAVKDVSLEVYPREILGLVGESGSGKSSIAKSIVRLAPWSGGKLYWHDDEISALGRRELRPYRRRIQMIFQDPYSSLNPRMKIGKAIQEPMEVHRIGHNGTERRERTIKLMEDVGLTAQQYDRYPHEFSGGQRQRICIARALACDPELLICDESVSALDVSVQAQVINLLLDIRMQRGLSMIFISHDLSVVRYVCDRMIVLESGSIVEEGIPAEIFARPSDPYTKRLIDSIPRM